MGNPYLHPTLQPQNNMMATLSQMMMLKMRQKEMESQDAYRQSMSRYHDESLKSLDESRQKGINADLREQAWQKSVAEANAGIDPKQPGGVNKMLNNALAIAYQNFPEKAKPLEEALTKRMERDKPPESPKPEIPHTAEFSGNVNQYMPNNALPALPTVQPEAGPMGDLQLQGQPGMGLQTPIPEWKVLGESKQTVEKPPDTITTDMKNMAGLQGLDVNSPEFKQFMATPQGMAAFEKIKTASQDPNLNAARTAAYQTMADVWPQRVAKPVFNKETKNWEQRTPNEINAEPDKYAPISFSQYEKNARSIGTLSGLNYHIDTLEKSIPIMMGSPKIAAALKQGKGSLSYAIRTLADQQLTSEESEAVAAMDNLRSAMLGAKQYVGPFPIGSDERVAIENAQLPGGEAFLSGNPNLAVAKLKRLKEEIRRNVKPQLMLIEKMGLSEFVPEAIGGTEKNPNLAGPPKTRASDPAVGSVVKGYRFKGGDPSKKENWEKVQ